MRQYSISAAAAGVLLLSVTLVRASYRVETYAESGVEESNTFFQVGYNAGGASPNLASIGYSTYGGDPTTSGGGNPTDTAGLAMASISYSNDNESFPAEPEVGLVAQTASASGSANASLAQGAIGVASSGTYLDRGTGSSGQQGGSGHAEAQQSDTLHFTIAGAAADTVTDIGVDYTITGNFSVLTAAGDSSGEISAYLDFGPGAHFMESYSANGTTDYIPVENGASASGWVSEYVSPDSATEFSFHGVYAITGASADLDIQETLIGSAGVGMGISYADTAAASFDLPTGVSFASDSGVFLTQAVPEPETLCLLAGVIMVSLRRRVQT